MKRALSAAAALGLALVVAYSYGTVKGAEWERDGGLEQFLADNFSLG